MFMIVILCCIDPPKELPPSRLKIASSGSMLQYGSLSGFLVTRGKPTRSLLWKVDSITPDLKTCALQQVPNDARALVIENHVELAQTYLKTADSPTPFACEP